MEVSPYVSIYALMAYNVARSDFVSCTRLRKPVGLHSAVEEVREYSQEVAGQTFGLEPLKAEKAEDSTTDAHVNAAVG